MFRVYVTDTLQAIGENTAILAACLTKGEAGKAMTIRWADRALGMEAQNAPAQDNRSPEEVVEYMKGKLAALSPG